MNIFLFQSVPERYDLRLNLRPGERHTWYATRYRNEMHRGDVAFFWMAGDEHFRGLYGWGILAAEPYIKTDWQSHGIDVDYRVKFDKPILAKSIHHETELADMLIFRAPQATNFLLTPRQAKKLVRLVLDRGEQAPELSGVEK